MKGTKKLNVSRKSYALDVFSAQQGENRIYVGSHRNEVKIVISSSMKVRFDFQGTIDDLLKKLNR